MKFTTSWDDGYTEDLRLAELLTRHGCTGTFYVCPKQQFGAPMLTEVQITELSKAHEIGAHTLTHPHLSECTPEHVEKEVSGSKAWVETLTGKPCTMFCYPRGNEAPWVRPLVRKAGFLGARTVEQFQFKTLDPYGLGTSLHVYPFPLRPVASRKILDPLRSAWPHAKELHIPLLSMRGWLPFAKALFDAAHQNNEPWFHLWGHSREVRMYNLWNDLEDFLKHVRKSRDIECVVNSSLVA